MSGALEWQCKEHVLALIRNTTTFFMAALISGCAVSTADAVKDSDELAKQWLRYPAEDQFDFEGFGWLENTEACEVFHSDFATALSELFEVPFKVLEGTWHQNFSSCRCDENAGEKAVLMRGVYFGQGNGELGVARLRDGIFVLYTGMGKPVNLKRSAVIACLQKVPRDVYVGIRSVL